MKILFIASEHFDYWTEYKGKKTKVINLDAREAVKDLIHQAVAEERERIVDLTKTSKNRYMFPETEERFLKDLASLDKPSAE